MSTAVWLNGERLTHLPLALPGWPFADGVFRTTLVVDGQVHDQAGQIAHLLADGRVLDLHADHADWAGWLSAAAQGCVLGRLRVMLLRPAGGVGYQPASGPADVWMDLQPLSASASVPAGVALRPSAITLAAQPALAGIKHLNRLEQVLAARAASAGADEALLCNAAGEPICSGRGNLFWSVDGAIHTPALDQCGVAGRTRARIMELAAGTGHPVRVGAWALASLQGADEVWVCNSLWGIRPVADCLGRRLPTPGPLTRQLIEQLQHPVFL